MLRIIGEQLTKVSAERPKLKTPINISIDVKTKGLSKQDFFVGGEKKQGMNFEFAFNASYNKIKAITIEGSVFFVGDKKELDDLEKAWKKKKVNEEVIIPLLNRAWQLASLQAMVMADKLKLPQPIRIPQFVAKKK